MSTMDVLSANCMLQVVTHNAMATPQRISANYETLSSVPTTSGSFGSVALKSNARVRGTKRHSLFVRSIRAVQQLDAPPAPSSDSPSTSASPGSTKNSGTRPLKILVAGAGIGGLVLALAAKNRGIDVQVFERDLTAIRGEGQYRGPIQIQSNALAALEAVDAGVAEEVMAAGCITGDRLNGLCDGLTGEWYVKFDTFTPAAQSGLPVTRVISRMTLQEILVNAVGPDIIHNGRTVVGFEEKGDKVSLILDGGETVEGDMLVGADGIRSKVRELLLGPSSPTYADYTCYTGICDFEPADIDSVGYRVFLGHKQYFVSSDVGGGKMQWYAFYNEPAGGKDELNARQSRLLSLFGHWCDAVTDLIRATPEEDILRRDIYDRIPLFEWGKGGRVTLLGDAAHAMQPNLGQGGCMAIEDSFQLALDLDKALQDASSPSSRAAKIDIPRVLKQYERKRVLRVAAIHGMARMAAIMASTYRAYFGEGLGPLEWIARLRIPHWGRMGGKVAMNLAMPNMLSWILGGNQFELKGRAPYCRLEDKARDELTTWMRDDDAWERGIEASWFLLPHGDQMPASGDISASGNKIHSIGSNSGDVTVIGSSPQLCKSSDGTLSSIVTLPGIDDVHARIICDDSHAFQLVDESKRGTWIVRVNGARFKLVPGQPTRLHPGDMLEFGEGTEARFRIKLRKDHAVEA